MTTAPELGINYDVGDPDAAPRRRATLDELRAHRDEIYTTRAGCSRPGGLTPPPLRDVSNAAPH